MTFSDRWSEMMGGAAPHLSLGSGKVGTGALWVEQVGGVRTMGLPRFRDSDGLTSAPVQALELP